MESGGAFYNYRKGQKDSTDREAVSVFYQDASGAVCPVGGRFTACWLTP